jgi:membrane protease YdiL (CAAX protease family)
MHDNPAQLVESPAVSTAITLLVAGCGLAWLLAVQRVRRGRPLIPYEARRRVPWRGGLVLLAFLVLEAPVVSAVVVSLIGAPEIAGPPPETSGEKLDVAHPIVDLLSADPGLTTWLLCGLVAVVIAPIVEEFMYRLVLQGWLEAEERRARRRISALRRFPPGVAPIVVVSMLFGLRHFRLATPPLEADRLVELMIVQAVWSLTAFALVLGILRIGSGASAADLGFVPRKLPIDVGLGLLVFLAVAAPVIFLQDLMTKLVPEGGVAPDPVPLFVLALALGIVYYRTHRIVPAIVIHAALNATSLGLAWLYFQAGPAG